MRVKCIDDARSPRLTMGQIYEVYEETASSYIIQDNLFKGGWNKSRFEIVAKDTPTTVGAAPTARQEKPCQVCSKLNDVGVSICWLCGNNPF